MKKISLEQTNLALKELSSALSGLSAELGQQQINAEQKDNAHKEELNAAQQKIDILTQCSQNAISNINELVSKLDKVLG